MEGLAVVSKYPFVVMLCLSPAVLGRTPPNDGSGSDTPMGKVMVQVHARESL